MPSSTLPSSPCLRRSLVALLLVLWAAEGASLVFAAESADLELLMIPESYFLDEGAVPNAVPGPGEILACGMFTDPRLSISDINGITVIGPNNRQLPLTVEEKSVFREFESIVSLKFFFTFSEKERLPGSKPFVIKWGEGVKADNSKVETIVLDSQKPDLYCEFRMAEAQTSSLPDKSGSTIEIIADSSARYHFLWYLVPMALIFVLLTIRKANAHDTRN